MADPEADTWRHMCERAEFILYTEERYETGWRRGVPRCEPAHARSELLAILVRQLPHRAVETGWDAGVPDGAIWVQL